jgi:DNA-binding LacI/PurR family transcriptional regulator
MWGGQGLSLNILWKQDFRRILFIKGPENHIDSMDRLAGLRLGLTERGLTSIAFLFREEIIRPQAGMLPLKKFLCRKQR